MSKPELAIDNSTKSVLMRTEVLSDGITDHARKVGMLLDEEYATVKSIEVDGDLSKVEVEITK